MSGIYHPHAQVLARAYGASVEDAQLAIVQADGSLQLAEAIVRVFVMAQQWPDVQRMKKNLAAEAATKRENEALASLISETSASRSTVLP